MKDKIQDVLSNYSEWEIVNSIDIDKALESYDIIEDIKCQLDNLEELLNIDIIYYASAMDYLKTNDPSLKESLELVSDMGFETRNLNSETLASILATENNRDEWFDEVLPRLIDELTECIDLTEGEEDSV